jgi:carbamoyltransferase
VDDRCPPVNAERNARCQKECELLGRESVAQIDGASGKQMKRPKIILGIGGALGHDANAALLADGKLVASSQEERFTRRKHDANFPRASILDCLRFANIQAKDVDACAFAEKPFQSLIFDRLGRSTNNLTWLLSRLVPDDRFLYPREARRLFPKARFYFAWHHLSHAAAAFATSPFERAAFLCVDGKGEDISASIGVVDRERCEILYELPYENGIGYLYTLVTYFLGFDSYGSEYKVMGLAPYGRPKFVKELRSFVALDEAGALRLKCRANFTWPSMQTAIAALGQHLGLPSRKKSEPLTDTHIDLSTSLQAIFETEILQMVRFAKKMTSETNLLFCGGCAQNCVAAGQIRRSGIFESIFNSPVGGDMGSAMGAALLVQREVCENNAGKVDTNGFHLGSEPGDPPNEALQHQIVVKSVHEAAAGLLAEGKVVGWVRGRMELGARALGARSILADPRVPKMQSILNLKVKFRESFRPFAPAILAEDCGDWFDTQEPADFMQYTAYLLEARRNPISCDSKDLRQRLDFMRCEIPSVVHVDYSARLQTVRKAVHPDFHRLICEFKKIAGIPMIINTSFNVSGQPIVRTAEEAWTCFRHTDIDYLVINDSIYRNPRDRTLEEKKRWLKQFAEYA